MRHLLLLALCLSFACSKSEAPAAQGAESPPATETAKAPPAASADTQAAAPGVSTRVISNGEPPRRAIRWSFEPGAKETIEIRTQLSTKMPNGESTRPPVTYALSLETTEVSADGTAKLAFRVDSIEVGRAEGFSEDQRASIRAALDNVKGMGGTYIVDSRGTVSAIELQNKESGYAGFERLLRQLLQRTTVPAPEEEVGQGAKWAIDRAFEEGEIRIDEAVSVELATLEGASMAIEASVATSAAEQTITKGPGIPAGGSITLLGVKGDGTIKGRWDLEKVSPTSLEIKSSETRTYLGPSPEGGEKPIELQYDTAVTMTRK